MTPRDVLAAAGIPVEAVSAALPGVDLDAVSLRRAPGLMTRLWAEGTGAMALPKAVYLSPDAFSGSPASLGPLLLHELVHIRQWKRDGIVGFLWRYVGAYLAGRLRGMSHRAAYLAIPAEAEARRITASLL